MFDNLRNFGNATGSGMRRVYGIALSHSSELNMLFNSKFGFNLFNSNDVRCKINDIELEWVKVTGDDRNGSVKTHSLEDRDNTLISSNISNSNRKYSIQVLLTKFGTENAQQKYDRIVELWQKKELCTVSTIETIEDIIITKVSRAYNNLETFEFSLDFEVLEFAYLMRKGEILEENKTVLSEEQRTTLTGTKPSTINWGGFLNAYRNR